jgi:hypothetical protein
MKNVRKREGFGVWGFFGFGFCFLLKGNTSTCLKAETMKPGERDTKRT